MSLAIKILTWTVALIIISINVFAQTSDRYKVLLNRENSKQLQLYDTIVPLEFLSEPRYESLTNMQIFEGFDYPKLNLTNNMGFTTLSNDSILVKLTTAPFDSVKFKRLYKLDRSLNQSSLYFRALPSNFEYHPFFPKTEISEITLTINDKKINVPNQHFKNLHNPSLYCWKYDKIEICGVNGYLSDSNKILLTLHCGEGAGAYIVIFVFSKNGEFEKRIEEPVI